VECVTKKLVRMATLPCMQSSSDKISKLLARFNITVHIPAMKNAHFLRPVKDWP
jgi:hypothetical protein